MLEVWSNDFDSSPSELGYLVPKDSPPNSNVLALSSQALGAATNGSFSLHSPSLMDNI